jgi:hypothetical protein
MLLVKMKIRQKKDCHAGGAGCNFPPAATVARG